MVTRAEPKWKSVTGAKLLFDTPYFVLRQWTDDKKQVVQMAYIGWLQDIVTNRAGTRTIWHVDDNYQIDDVTHYIEIPKFPEPLTDKP